LADEPVSGCNGQHSRQRDWHGRRRRTSVGGLSRGNRQHVGHRRTTCIAQYHGHSEPVLFAWRCIRAVHRDRELLRWNGSESDSICDVDFVGSECSDDQLGGAGQRLSCGQHDDRGCLRHGTGNNYADSNLTGSRLDCGDALESFDC